MADLGALMDFMEDEDGFESPRMPSTAHPDGRSYHVASPNAEVGLRLSALADLTMKQAKGIELNATDVRRLRLDDQQELEFMEQVLGAALVATMVADGVKWEHLKRLGLYAFTYFGVSKDAADEAAANGLFSGKGQAPVATNRATRRASTTGAKSTKPRASGASKKPKAAPSASA